MGTVALEPASGRSHAELAALFTAGYEGYFMPVAVDESAFSFMVGTWRCRGRRACRGPTSSSPSTAVLDRPHQLLAGRRRMVSSSSPVDAAKGSGRCRRRRSSLDERGIEVVVLWLEVLAQNEPAIRLYEKLGYRVVRELEVWSLDELVLKEHDVASVPVADAVGRSPQRPPWQRADATVKRQDDARALVRDDGSLVFRSGNGVASILQAAGDADAIRRLVESLPAGTTGVRYLNGPEGEPVNAALEALGGTCVARQHEMLLELG